MKKAILMMITAAMLCGTMTACVSTKVEDSVPDKPEATTQATEEETETEAETEEETTTEAETEADTTEEEPAVEMQRMQAARRPTDRPQPPVWPGAARRAVTGRKGRSWLLAHAAVTTKTVVPESSRPLPVE